MPDGTKTGVVLHLIGTDNPKYKEFDRQLSIKNLKKMADKSGNISFDINNLEDLLENNEKTAVEKAAICIVGWDGLTENGKAISHSHDNALGLLKTEGMEWVVDFVNAFVSDRANFIKG